MKNSTKKNNVVQLGNPSKPTIIFAHGFGTDQNAWAEVIKSFLEDYHIILFDNVGGGASDPEAYKPSKYDSLYAYADDLIDICVDYQVKDAIMVGHSVSGMVSVLTAIKRPELFSKLVLIGASPRYLNDDNYFGGFEQHDLNVIYETMATNYFAWVSGFSVAAMANPEKPQLAESFATSLKSIRPDIAQSVSRVIFQSDYRSELSKLSKPTLLIQTKHDIAVPTAVATYLNQQIPNSFLEIINAEGHFPHISAPDEIVKSLKKFI